MKYLWLILPCALVVFLAVLLIRAMRLKARPKPEKKAFKASFDESAALAHFEEMIRLRTVWPRFGEIDKAQFDAFLPLLRRLYPKLFEVLEVNVVNGYGLLLRWKGTTDAPPVVLMSHYDVVAADETKWTHPPFCGEEFDGRVWGRGTVDTKCILAALMEAGETLLKTGFTPSRDLYFSFTNNEETGGDTSPAIVDFLEARGVRPWFVLDEGGAIVHSPALGVPFDFAMIGVSEKGVVDTVVTANGVPGHSSTPKDTDAPMRLIRAIDSITSHPFPAKLSEATRQTLLTVAAYAGFPLRLVFGNLWLFAPLVKKIMEKDPETAALLRTTVALTQLQGSDTVNILPNRATAAFSVRVAPWDTTDAVLEQLNELAGEHAEAAAQYRFEPSPISPIDSDAFRLLAGTVDAVYPGVPSAPYVMTGGTDSKHFTRICDKVYRFGGFRFNDAERAAMHGNDETLRVDSFLDGVSFYVKLLENISKGEA